MWRVLFSWCGGPRRHLLDLLLLQDLAWQAASCLLLWVHCHMHSRPHPCSPVTEGRPVPTKLKALPIDIVGWRPCCHSRYFSQENACSPDSWVSPVYGLIGLSRLLRPLPLCPSQGLPSPSLEHLILSRGPPNLDQSITLSPPTPFV